MKNENGCEISFCFEKVTYDICIKLIQSEH